MSTATQAINELTMPVRTAWDTIAAGYSKYLTHTHTWLGNEGLKRAGVQKGTYFLDVAAGSGALSIPAARLGARVLATDISPLMLDELEKNARDECLTVETRAMDGHALELEDNRFDVVGSQFGVMLFPDMPRGIREMARVTRPGGHVLMNVYGNPRQIEFFNFFISGIQAVLPEFTGPDETPLPFQLQDPERLRKELADAGLRNIQVETITECLHFRNGNELWNWLINSNPVVTEVLSELALTPEQTDTVRQALDRLIVERTAGKELAVLTNPVNIAVATK